jgi:hypothetical protein
MEILLFSNSMPPDYFLPLIVNVHFAVLVIALSVQLCSIIAKKQELNEKCRISVTLLETQRDVSGHAGVIL